MSKYRIVEIGGIFYPEQKKLFRFKRIKPFSPEKISFYTYSDETGIGAFNAEDAKAIVLQHVKLNTPTYHEVKS